MSPPTVLILDTSMTAPTASGSPSSFSHMERVTKVMALGSSGSLQTNNAAEISNSIVEIIVSSGSTETATPSFTQLSTSSASSTSQSSGTYIRPTKGCWVVAVMLITGLVITN